MYLPEFMTIAGQPVPASRMRHRLLRRLTKDGIRRSADGEHIYYRGQELDPAAFRQHLRGTAVRILRGDAHRQERAGMRREARSFHRQAAALESPDGAVWARIMAVHIRPALLIDGGP